MLRRVHARGHALFFLSNMPAPYADHLEAEHAFLELFPRRPVFGSGADDQPSRRSFAHAQRVFAIDPADTLFIDDLAPTPRPRATPAGARFTLSTRSSARPAWCAWAHCPRPTDQSARSRRWRMLPAYFMNQRRHLLLLVGAGLAAGPPARAQSPDKLYRIGWLTSSPLSVTPQLVEAFGAGMRELGWIEGRHYAIENLYSEGRNERLPALAAELVRRRVDLIVCAGSATTAAAKAATTTIPSCSCTSATRSARIS